MTKESFISYSRPPTIRIWAVSGPLGMIVTP